MSVLENCGVPCVRNGIIKNGFIIHDMKINRFEVVVGMEGEIL